MNTLTKKELEWCQLVAQGEDATEAYAKVFGLLLNVVLNPDEEHFLKCFKLLHHNQEAKELIEKIKEDISRETQMPVDERIRRLIRIIETPLSQMEPGDPLLQEYHYTDTGGQKIRVKKKPCPIEAIHELNLLTGAYPESSLVHLNIPTQGAEGSNFANDIIDKFPN